MYSHFWSSIHSFEVTYKLIITTGLVENSEGECGDLFALILEDFNSNFYLEGVWTIAKKDNTKGCILD